MSQLTTMQDGILPVWLPPSVRNDGPRLLQIAHVLQAAAPRPASGEGPCAKTLQLFAITF